MRGAADVLHERVVYAERGLHDQQEIDSVPRVASLVATRK